MRTVKLMTATSVMRLSLLVFFIIAAALISPSYAFTIHYDSSRSEAVRICDDLMYRGDDEASVSCYSELLESAEGLDQADAAAALGDTRQANRLYRELAANSSDPAIKTHWAQLYLQTHQISDAEALFR